jgi:hypothetical protein
MREVRVHEAIGLVWEGDECRVILPAGLALIEVPPDSPRHNVLLGMEIFAGMSDHAAANIVAPWRAQRRANAAGEPPAPQSVTPRPRPVPPE